MKSICLLGNNIKDLFEKEKILQDLNYDVMLDPIRSLVLERTFEQFIKDKLPKFSQCNEVAFCEDWRESKEAIFFYDIAKRLKIPMKFFKGDTLEDKPQIGFKMSADKIKWSLLDLSGLHGMLSVLMHGSLKYSDDNWKRVPNGKQEYYNALMRHISDLRSGKEYDEETGQLTIYCIQINAYFLGYFIEQEKKV